MVMDIVENYEWISDISNNLIKSVELEITTLVHADDTTKPIKSYKPSINDVTQIIREYYNNVQKPISVREYKKTLKNYKHMLYVFELHYKNKNQQQFICENIKEYQKYKFVRKTLNEETTKYKLLSEFTCTDHLIDNKFNKYDYENNRAYRIKYLRNSSMKLDTKYIQIYRKYKKNKNMDISKYYDHMKIDNEYTYADDNGAYKITDYEKDYNKVIGKNTQTIDKISVDYINIWNELTGKK